MGIDSFDLAHRLEQRFGIVFGEAERQALIGHTVRTLHRHLLAKLRGECDKVPDIEPLFTEICRIVHRLTKRWRLTLSLSTDLNRRFPATARLEKWRALEKELGLSLPPLEHAPGDRHPTVPQPCSSVMGLCRWIAEHHPDRVEWLPIDSTRTGPAATHSWTEQEVWQALGDCLIDVLGVEDDEITFDARLVEDLGME